MLSSRSAFRSRPKFIRHVSPSLGGPPKTDMGIDMDKKAGWGHSTFEQAIELGIDGNVKNIVLTHHDPMRKDTELKSILKNLKKHYNNVNINAAKEFLSFEF